ncbi:MAG: alpha/beta fold hydrolase [Mycobacterium sp.]
MVLLHPATSSGRAWRELEPMLSEYHEIHTPTMLGHRGGPVPQRRPVTSDDVVDSAEAYLDAHGLDRPHLVGNSGGGSAAIELARRGRAASVCALSLGGLWSDNYGAAARRVHRLIRVGGVTIRLLNPVAPLLLKSAAGPPYRTAQLRVSRRAAQCCASPPAGLPSLETREIFIPYRVFQIYPMAYHVSSALAAQTFFWWMSSQAP